MCEKSPSEPCLNNNVQPANRLISESMPNTDNLLNQVCPSLPISAETRLNNNNGALVGPGSVPASNQDHIAAENTLLEFLKDYPIKRFGRKWRRQEVQGICCLAVEIFCMATLAVLSLHALGYIDTDQKIVKSETLPYSFSAKVLGEFFLFDEPSAALPPCFFSPGEHDSESDDTSGSYVVGISEQKPSQRNKVLMRKRCNLKYRVNAPRWLAKFLTVHFVSILTCITSVAFLFSLRIRRRRGIQVVLLLPPFVCFFLSMFQQLPVTYRYNYVGIALRDEIRNAMLDYNFEVSPELYDYYKSTVPLMDNTQINMQCCGLDFPMDYEHLPTYNVTAIGTYPKSCCNTTAFDCAAKSEFIPKSEAWVDGCYQKEYDRVRMFERCAFLLLGLKIIAEIGIFCSLSDLTRFEYPPADTIEKSRCDFREYQIRTRGIASIKGVTKDGRIVVKANCFLPWRLVLSRVELMNGMTLFLRTELHRGKGCVEIVRRTHLEHFRNENIQLNLSRKNHGVYVISLN